MVALFRFAECIPWNHSINTFPISSCFCVHCLVPPVLLSSTLNRLFSLCKVKFICNFYCWVFGYFFHILDNFTFSVIISFFLFIATVSKEFKDDSKHWRQNLLLRTTVSIENRNDCDATSSVARCVTSLATCTVMISCREKMWILIVVEATTALNQSTNSGRSKLSYIKWSLCTKLKFSKYGISLNAGTLDRDLTAFAFLKDFVM
jgi:hypothetical protein